MVSRLLTLVVAGLSGASRHFGSLNMEFTGTPRRSRATGHGGRATRMSQMLLLDVASQAKAVLAQSRIFDLRRLDVDQQGECVVIRGRVDSFYHKQLAQELVRTALDGAADVINAIRVVYGRERPGDPDWQW